MTETMHGHVDAVRLELAGDVVTSALSVGATQVPIGDAADFDESGGSLTFDGTTIYTYTMLDDGDDSGTPLLSISPTLAVAVAAGDPVRVWNANTSPADYVKEWVASITDDLDGNSIEATVSHALIGRLDEGVEALSGRSVVCTMDEDDDWVVVDVIGENSVITGALIRTAADGPRVEISQRPTDSGLKDVRFYTDSPDEVEPGFIGSIEIPGPNVFLRTEVRAPDVNATGTTPDAKLVLETVNDYAWGSRAELNADIVELNAVAGGVIINGGRALREVDFGEFQGTANASGEVTVSHGLGSTPVSIIVTNRQTGAARTNQVTAETSTNFTVITRDGAGAPIASGANARFFWVAIR